MTQRLKVPPTKSVLLALKRRMGFLEQGHDMLERKKELLTRLVYERLAQYRSLRRQIGPAIEAAYRSLGITHMRMGARMLRQISVGLPPGLAVQILPRSSLGVEYPAVRVEPLAPQPVGLMWTEASFDEARSQLTTLAVMLAKLGEAEAALWRLLAEQRRTQKRVNALKYNIIPRHRATIRFIESALEEEERNTLFQIRLLKDRPVPSD
jgi:V/A-type H+-transporting ATPase subunit D